MEPAAGPKVAEHVVDADGHVLEPASLWLEYLEAAYVDRAIRLQVNDEGLEVVVVDNRPFDRLGPGGIALIGSMGEEGAVPSPDRRYMDVMPFGACDPADRIAYCDKEGLDGVVLYPTEHSGESVRAVRCFRTPGWVSEAA
jgi:hypothetical protein